MKCICLVSQRPVLQREQLKTQILLGYVRSIQMNDIWETEGMNEGGFAGYMQPLPGVTGSVPHAFSPPTLQTPTSSSHDHWELGQAEQRLADSIARSQSARPVAAAPTPARSPITSCFMCSSPTHCFCSLPTYKQLGFEAFTIPSRDLGTSCRASECY